MFEKGFHKALWDFEYDNGVLPAREYYKNLTEAVLPEALIAIGENAFADCTSLQRVVLPESLRIIADGAFSGCTSLTDVTLPNGLEEVGPFAFSRTAVKEFRFPKTLKVLGEGALWGCKNLESCWCPPLKELPSRLFSDCTNLAYVSIPDGVEVLGSQMFHQCDRMILGGSIALPPSIREMDFTFSVNDIDIFNVYAVPGSFAYKKAIEMGVRVYPVSWEPGAETYSR